MIKARDILKSLLNFYQSTFWYIAQAKNEALKPLGFWNETLLILTFLTVSGTKLSTKEVLLGYVAVLCIAAIVGKIIVYMGIVQYNTRIANEQNPELMLILNKVTELETAIAKNSCPHHQNKK